jgi:hypothetical protein
MGKLGLRKVLIEYFVVAGNAQWECHHKDGEMPYEFCIFLNNSNLLEMQNKVGLK